MAEYFREPQSPLKKIDKTTGDIYYIYPQTTANQVIINDAGVRLNAKLDEIQSNIDDIQFSINNINPEVTADKVIMASGLTLQETIGSINRIDFTDEEGNSTDEPYIHWYVDSETGEVINIMPSAEDGEF